MSAVAVAIGLILAIYAVSCAVGLVLLARAHPWVTPAPTIPVGGWPEYDDDDLPFGPARSDLDIYGRGMSDAYRREIEELRADRAILQDDWSELDEHATAIREMALSALGDRADAHSTPGLVRQLADGYVAAFGLVREAVEVRRAHHEALHMTPEERAARPDTWRLPEDWQDWYRRAEEIVE